MENEINNPSINNNNNEGDNNNNNNNNNNSTSYSSHDYSINEYTLSDSENENESIIGILGSLANIDDGLYGPLVYSKKSLQSNSNHDINYFSDINNNDGGDGVIVGGNGNDGADDEKPLLEGGVNSKGNPLFKHKYRKDILLTYLTLTLLVMAALVYSLFLPGVFSNYVNINFPELSKEDAQAKATYYKSYSDSLPYIFMFIFGPLGGVISDKYGRKIMMLYGVFITVLDMVSCWVTIKTNNLYYYYIVHSIAGTSNVSLAAVYSYIADISEEHDVPFLYSYAGVSLALGVVVGPVISIITTIGGNHGLTMTTLYVAAGLVASNLLIIPFLKESLTIAKENNKIKITKSTSNPFKLVKLIFTANGYVTFVILLFVSISYTSQDIMATYFYHNSLMYGWGQEQNSIWMGGLGIVMVIWSAFIVPFFLKKYSERKIISVGFLVGAITHCCYAFAYNQWIWVSVSVVSAFVSCILNLLQSVISRATPPEIKGSILTGTRAIGALAGFLGSLVANNIYREFSSENAIVFFPGAPYLISSVITLFTFFASLLIWRKYRNPNPLIRKSTKKKINIIKKSLSSTNVSINQ